MSLSFTASPSRPAAAGIKLNGALVAGGNVVWLRDQPGQQPGGLSGRPRDGYCT